MFEIFLSELHHNSVLTKCGWTAWMFLHVMVSGTRSLVTVHQPPVITSALGSDVIMPCQLNLSSDEKMVTSPVLYWEHLTRVANNPRLWIPSEEYEGRVHLLEENPNSSNKSLLLKSVQWEDTGKYLCKVTITTEKDKSLRMRGNETLLMIYDAMTFNLPEHNDSLLRCEVNVTRGPGFVLSILRDGRKPQTVDSAPGTAVTLLTHVTLSETVLLRGGGEYECQLHLNEDLVVKSIIHYLSTAGEGGGAGEIVLTPWPTVVSESGVVEFPEPWLLYVLHLLVPFAFLLGLVTSLLCRR
ncbi:uncharacterized protein LOC118313266 isoform X2 [Scophthalmus maximus]|uniref:uncharacterized protein LOC118313266 isoform X2 n=1 Tax=Scophthalmus maximus TaxID=52904 RepID=UPI001FA8E3EE|nr:uncharacterized protein LOC118313266 isoform X2 [Scophthalmus maximus]